jgi:hypothetical protein
MTSNACQQVSPQVIQCVGRLAVDVAETTASPHHKAYRIARELGPLSSLVSVESVAEILESLFEGYESSTSERIQELESEVSSLEYLRGQLRAEVERLKDDLAARTELADSLIQRAATKEPRLTKIQRVALAQLCASPDGAASVWHFASMTIHRLRKLNYIGPVEDSPGLIAVTEAGRAAHARLP